MTREWKWALACVLLAVIAVSDVVLATGFDSKGFPSSGGGARVVASGTLANDQVVCGSGTSSVDSNAGLTCVGSALTAGALSATTSLTLNTAGGADLVCTEAACDRASGSATEVDFTNSGAGAMTLKVDGVAALTTSTGCQLTGCTMTGQVVSSNVATDVATGTNEAYTIATTGATYTLGGTAGSITVTPAGSTSSAFSMKAGGTDDTSDIRLLNSADAVTGQLAYYGSAHADADYQDKFALVPAARPLWILSATDIAAGTAILAIMDNLSGSGSQLFSVDGSGNIFLNASATRSKGTIALSSGTGTATVASGSVCVCSDTSATTLDDPVQCSVSSTTLTATIPGGTSSDTIAYHCM